MQTVPKRRRASQWPLRAGLLFVTLGAYANSFNLGLVEDSAWIVARDSRIRDATAANLRLIAGEHYWWPIPFGNLYRPVTTVSLLFNYAILGNGAEPAGYHLVNFLLHLGNVWLVFELSFLVLRSRWPAFFAAALWGVHPVGVESVVNVVGRADLLAAMALLGALVLYARHSANAGPRRFLSVLALGAVAAAGMFSKESAAVLPALLFLWDLSFESGPLKKRLAQTWPFYAAAIGSLLLLLWARHSVLAGVPRLPVYAADNPLLAAGFWTARFTAIKVIGLDLGILLFPLRLSADRSYNQIPFATPADPVLWLTLLSLAALLFFISTRFRRDRLWFWCAGFFAIAILPTSNLLFPIGAIMAERFLYLPSVALVIALVALLYRCQYHRIVIGILIGLGLLFMVRTLVRNPNWDTPLSLAAADLKTAPQSARLHDMLALALFTSDPQHNIDRVIEEQTKSCRILSPLPAALSSDRPLTYLGMYDLFKAEISPAAQGGEWREKALAALLQAKVISQAAEKAYASRRDRPAAPAARTPYPVLYLTLGDVYNELARYPEAIEAFRYGQTLDPAAVRAYDGLSAAYTAMGNPASAVIALEEKALLDNSQPQTLAAIAAIYRNLPEASCAFVRLGAGWQLNPGCPQVKGDLCAANAGLAQAWTAAGQPDKARDLAGGAQQLGCKL